MYRFLIFRKFLLFFFLFMIPGEVIFPQVTGSDGKLRQIVNQYHQAEVTVPYADNKTTDLITRNTSILSVENNTIHLSLSPLTIDWFISQKFDYKIVNSNISLKSFSVKNISDVTSWKAYPSYTQYDSIMRSFVTEYPSLCRLDTIGTSINGKLILALKISDNANTDEDEPKVFYTSTIHGNETGGFVLMLHLIDYLLKNYSTSDRVKNLVDNLELWINPLSNPDGTFGTGNVISSPTRYNANGIDLNRNFPDPLTPNTVKQKETLSMMDFLKKHRFVLSVNFHSGEEVVNYPWDRWLSKLHADNSWFNHISREYADTAHVYGGSDYMTYLDNGVTRGAVWYVVYGGRQDYVTWELQGREVTIELDYNYITPEDQLLKLWESNWRSMLGYSENALYGIHGLVRNINTHDPVVAKVYITGHDKDSSQVYSDTTNGRFVRMLYPGSWNLTFSAKGYRDTTITNIAVSERQRVDLIIDMKPGTTAIEIPNSTKGVLLYPNPAKYSFFALLPDTVSGEVRIKMYDLTGRLISDYYTEAYLGIPLTVDVSSLSAGLYTVVFTSPNTGLTFRAKFMIAK